MNELLILPEKKEAEIVPLDRQVQCSIKANPFLSKSFIEMVAAGATIEDMVCQFVDDKWPSSFIHCHIDGTEVPRELWHRVRPKPGHKVTVCVTPLGGRGGGGSAQAIVGILLIVVGVVLIATGWGAAWLGPMFLKMGIGMTLSGALQLAFAPKAPSMGQLSGGPKRSQALFIRGARNSAKPFEVVPRVYGEHKIVPAYGSMPYTEESSDKQYLRMLFCLGYGPLEISDLKIGDTAIEEFDLGDANIEIRHGFPSDPDITIFPSTVITTEMAVTLTTDWITRTTLPDCDEISLDFEFPRGLFSVGTSGKTRSAEVQVSVEYRKTGTSGEWIAASGFPRKYNQEKTSPFLEGTEFRVAKGQYDVRVKRANDQSNNAKKSDQVVWSALRTIRHSDPVKTRKMFPENTTNYRGGIAKIALKIQATDQLNNIIDTFNCRVRSILMDYGNYALSFNGSASQLSSTSFYGPLGSSKRTIEAMVYARGTGGIFMQGDPDTGSTLKRFGLAVQNGATSTWRVWINSTTYHDVVINGSMNSWHHYALTYDGTNVRLYYDGTLKGTWAHALNTQEEPFMLGATRDDEITSKANAYIKQVRIWSVAKSQSEIAALCDTVINSIRGPELLAYWRLTEGSGEKIYDYSRSSKHLKFPTSSKPTWYKGPDEGRIWEPRPTSNPGAHLRDLFQGAANKRAVSDSRIDLQSIEDFGTYCRDKARTGMPEGWTFNYVFDYASTVFEAARLIAAAGRGSISMKDGKYCVVHDIPKTTPVQEFNPRNSHNLRGVKHFLPETHAVRVRYVSKELDFEQTELTVYNDGYNENNATKFESDELKGATNKELVHDHTRYMMACAQLRPESFEITTDFEHLVCTRGDLVRVSHDVISVGQGWGRIKSITRDGTLKITHFALDNKVTMAGGKSYAIGLRQGNGSFTYGIKTVAGETSTLELTTPTRNDEAEADNLYNFGESGLVSMDCIVVNISPEEDLAAKITLQPAAPGVHTAETKSIPVYDPKISHAADVNRRVSPPVITGIISDSTVAEVLPGGQRRARILLKYKITNGNNIPASYVHPEYRKAGSKAPYISLPYARINASRNVYVTGVQPKTTYDVRLCAVSESGIRSTYSSTRVYVQSVTVQPPDVKDFWITENKSGEKYFNWRFAITPPDDFAGVVIRGREGTGYTWSDLYNAHSGVIVNSPWKAPWPLKRVPYTFGTMTKNTAGEWSANAKIITYTPIYKAAAGMHVMEEMRAQRWPGTIVNGFINNVLDDAGVGELQGKSYRTWADLSGTTWSAWTNWTNASVVLTYTTPVIDAEEPIRVIPSGHIGYEGTSIATYERHSNDNVNWTSWSGLSTTIPLFARYFQFKAEVTGNPPIIREFNITL